MNVRRTTRSFGHRHRPPVLHGRLMASFQHCAAQQTQISRKCAHFDARRYVRGSVPEFNARVYGVIALRSGVEV